MPRRKYEPVCSGTKVCNKCGRELHVLHFAADKKGADGIAGKCRACKSEENRRYRKKRVRGPRNYSSLEHQLDSHFKDNEIDESWPDRVIEEER